MKVGAIIETVYLKVKGGQPDSGDVNVKRIDIRTYLPAAVNFALRKQYYIDKQEGETSLPNNFVASFENVPVLENEDRGLKYVDMPSRVVALPKDMGVNLVAPMKGFDDFIRIDNPYQSNGYAKYIKKTMYFIEGDRIYFRNISDKVCKVLVRMMAAFDEFNDDEEAPIPAGLEAEVIQILFECYMGQRAVIEDNKNNSTDEKQV